MMCDPEQRQRHGRRALLKMADYDDVTLSLHRDVSDDANGVTPGLTSMSYGQTAGCLLYTFVVDSVNGLVCVLGFVGNLIAFAVFYKDTMKTSTSFLFQVTQVASVYGFIGRRQQ